MSDSGFRDGIRALASEGGVRSVQVALDVLETVAFAHEELGVTQIADLLGLTKGSVHRHLLTLVDRGYLSQNAKTARYSVGPKIGIPHDTRMACHPHCCARLCGTSFVIARRSIDHVARRPRPA